MTVLPVLALVALVGPRDIVAQGQTVVAHSVSVSEDGSSLQLELTNGRTITIELARGNIHINGEEVGAYSAGGALEESWRSLISHGGELNSTELIEALQAWEIEGLQATEMEIQEAIEMSLANLDVVVANAVVAAQAAAVAQAEAQVGRQARRNVIVDRQATGRGIVIDLERPDGFVQQLNESSDELRELGIAVENGRVHLGDLTVRRGEVIEGNLAVLSGDVSVYGTLNGNLATINGDVLLHDNGRIDGDLVMVNGALTRGGGRVTGTVRSVRDQLRLARRDIRNATREVRDALPVQGSRNVRPVSGAEAVGQHIATLLGFFVALSCIGFGFTFFMPRQLEVISDTVSGSFGKSFMAGLFATPLVLPLAVMLIAGLAITVVGIPLAVLVALALPFAVIASAVGGYLATAKTVGNSYLLRRMAEGKTVAATPYRSMVYGLGGLLAIWIPAVLLGWIPLAGQLFAALALAVTWVMATAGVGAAILSRAGLRATFVQSGGPPALTDEHYWPVDASNYTPARRGRAK
jgi:cytoskeletal protein CcmA (bactofilin family)